MVHGILDDSLHEKFMRTPDLDLNKCISICCVAEIVRGQAEEMKSETTSAVGEVQREQATDWFPKSPARNPVKQKGKID